MLSPIQRYALHMVESSFRKNEGSYSSQSLSIQTNETESTETVEDRMEIENTSAIMDIDLLNTSNQNDKSSSDEGEEGPLFYEVVM